MDIDPVQKVPDELIDRWPGSPVAAMAFAPQGPYWQRGDVDRPFALASLTKLITATTVLVAVEEETLTLNTPAGPAGSTIAHLLAHASGIGPGGAVLTEPGRRRIYSNAGYEILAGTLARSARMPFERYVAEAVGEPLGWSATRLTGSPAHGAVSTVREMSALLDAWLDPGTILASTTIERATDVFISDLAGVLPGFGAQDPNPWGLGPELRGDKAPHWTGNHNSPATFGHFGRSGTMCWVDPEHRCGLVVLGEEPFGDWATELWPELSDAVLESMFRLGKSVQ